MMAFLGQLFVGFLVLVALLALIGGIIAWRRAAKGEAPQENDVLSEETVDNVLNLNDRFNRARYQDEDGK